MRSALLQIHWLVGITAGCVLALCGLTGAMLSFEEQIIASLNEEARTVQPRADQALPVGALLSRIQRLNPPASVRSLTVFSDPSKAAKVTFAGKRPGADEESRYVNPYTDALSTEAGDRGEALFRLIRAMHRWLMLGEWGDRDVGRQIVGATTVSLLVLCATGLYLRWPRHGHKLREWLVADFSLRGRGLLRTLHAVLGTWALLPCLVIAVTGLQWSYEWYRDGLYALAGVERLERRKPPHVPGTWPDLSVPWSVFLRETQGCGYSRATLQAPRASAPLEIRYLERHPAHSRAFNTLTVDPMSGEVLRHERYAEKNAGGKLVSSMFALHSGQFFGMPGVFAFMLASLAMPLFAVTGWMLYLDRRRRKARSRLRLQVMAVTQPR